jgi:hypothetical protein
VSRARSEDGRARSVELMMRETKWSLTVYAQPVAVEFVNQPTCIVRRMFSTAASSLNRSNPLTTMTSRPEAYWTSMIRFGSPGLSEIETPCTSYGSGVNVVTGTHGSS